MTACRPAKSQENAEGIVRNVGLTYHEFNVLFEARNAEIYGMLSQNPQIGAADESAFRPAKEFLCTDFPTYKAIDRFLERHPEIRQYRPEGRFNRRNIHAGDWHAALERERSRS